MANRVLLQTILRFSDDIKSGAAKVQDVVTDYFNTTGKSVTDEERGIILKEFQDNAPSNVVEDVFTKAEGIDSISLKDDLMKTDNPFSDLVKTTEEGPKTLDQRRADAIKELGSDKPVTGKINYPAMQTHLGVTLRGNETFDELLEIEKAIKLKNKAKTGMPEFDEILDAEFKKAFGKKESKEGLGSLYPKGEPGEIFDTANSKRTDLAGFMKAMRGAGIKNEDVMNTAKMTDVAQGKRAATTLARAADMGADTKIKQEFLSELDETIMDKGPRFFQEEFQGYDSYGALLKDKGREVRFAIFDDLEALGVEEDKASSILDFANDVATRNPNQPEAYLEAIKQDLEMSNIKYDMSFWEKYISKILELSSKAEPRFAGGGLV